MSRQAQHQPRRRPFRGGQAIVEYVLVLIVLLLGVLVAVRKDGPVEKGMNGVLTSTETWMQTSAQNAQKKFK